MQRNRSHRDPVSCQSCRAKKLKCNRVQPCANCTNRNIDCQFLLRPPTSAQRGTRGHDAGDLLERIEWLEAWKSRVHNAASRYDAAAKDLHSTPLASTELDSPVAPINLGEMDQTEDVEILDQNQDAQILESVGTRETLLLPDLSNDFRIEVKSIPDFLDQHNANGGRAGMVLPTYTDATVLLHGYESNVDHVYRILHMPTLKSQMRSYYLNLARNEPVPAGQTALLAAIFALAVFFYNPQQTGQLVRNDDDSVSLARAFSKTTLDALDHSRRETSGLVEDVQAYILASVIMFYLDGYSARGRLLSSTAIVVAREIGLLYVDQKSDSVMLPGCKGQELIDVEVRRRVMWHLVATDWLSSLASGPQEGTYLLHPRHIQVQYPSISSDDDLGIGERSALPSEILPGMTYFWERVRLAELCRKIVDQATADSAMSPPYDFIIAADGDLLEYLNSLPYFFRLDADSRARAKDLETVHPTLGLLRYLITQTVHSRRVKLHRTFLLRRSSNPKYEYSRNACLDSARLVVQSFESLAEGGCSWVMVARMGLAVHYLHLALAVFVMDLCCNPTATNRSDIKSELWAILFKLEGLRNASTLLERSLTSLNRVLQKHEINLDDTHTSGPANNGLLPHYTQHANNRDTMDGQGGGHVNSTPANVGANAFDAYLNDAWESAIQLNQDDTGWEAFFDRFDNHPL